MSEHEPIIPNEIVLCLIAALDTRSQDQAFVIQQRRLLKKIVRMLSRIRALTLGYLIRYLH
jgi:hypothetical protein